MSDTIHTILGGIGTGLGSLASCLLLGVIGWLKKKWGKIKENVDEKIDKSEKKIKDGKLEDWYKPKTTEN